MTKLSIGSQLKKARQKKEVTLPEVYQQTRIHPNILSALEEDRCDKILNPIYIRSFLKEYASYLGLDVKKLLEEYNKLHPRREPRPIEQPTGEEGTSLPRINTEAILKIGKIVAVLVLVIALFSFLIKIPMWVVNRISQRLALRAQQAQLAKIKKPTKPPEAKKVVAARRKATKKKEVLQKPSAKPVSTRLKKVSVPIGEKLKLSIAATDNVWIQLKVDGKPIFQNVLRKGSSETWEADKNFEIWTGRAEAMQLDLNGNDLGAPGSGVKRGIIITREGIKK